MNHVLCDGGLCNRLNALIFALILKRRFGGEWSISWPRNNWCGAAFERLFTSALPVDELTIEDYKAREDRCLLLMHENQVGFAAERLIINKTLTSYEQYGQLLAGARSDGLDVVYFNSLLPPFVSDDEVRDALALLDLNAEVAGVAGRFVAEHGIDASTIGLHIRKTDFGDAVDDQALFTQVQGHARRFFVCSDDAAVNRRFAALPNCAVFEKTAFPEKLEDAAGWQHWTTDAEGRRFPFNINRGDVSVVEGLVDLLILSRTEIVVTSGSTFLSTARLFGRCGFFTPEAPSPGPSVQALLPPLAAVAGAGIPHPEPSMNHVAASTTAAAPVAPAPSAGTRSQAGAERWGPRMKLDRVISVCMSKDLPYWEAVSRKLLECVDSHSYEVIVPDHEVALFRQVTPSRIQVIPEVYYCGKRDLNHLRERFPAALRNRAGWYLQQFLKVEAIRREPRDVNCLIWDADTVPLRRIEFADEAGRITYRTGLIQPAIHQPYFDLIESVLGISREIDESFISQCFPVRSRWVHEMCAQITSQHRVECWWDAIVDYVAAHPSFCGFSEYETLGSFILKHHRDEIKIRAGQFFRPGNRVFPLDRLEQEPTSRIAQSLEYIAYDNYDQTVYGGLNIGCGHTRLEQTFDGKRFLNIDTQPTLATDLTLNLNQPLPFADQSFSHIVAHNTLQHVDDLMSSIVELDRVLSRGGVLQIEVPHIGSYNHGTDARNKRGLTFDSFNFLHQDRNYLFTQGGGPFKYRLLSFNRENWVDGQLVREQFDHVPALGSYPQWVNAMRNFEIPGTFGYVFQKL